MHGENADRGQPVLINPPVNGPGIAALLHVSSQDHPRIDPVGPDPQVVRNQTRPTRGQVAVQRDIGQAATRDRFQARDLPRLRLDRDKPLFAPAPGRAGGRQIGQGRAADHQAVRPQAIGNLRRDEGAVGGEVGGEAAAAQVLGQARFAGQGELHPELVEAIFSEVDHPIRNDAEIVPCDRPRQLGPALSEGSGEVEASHRRQHPFRAHAQQPVHS